VESIKNIIYYLVSNTNKTYLKLNIVKTRQVLQDTFVQCLIYKKTFALLHVAFSRAFYIFDFIDNPKTTLYVLRCHIVYCCFKMADDSHAKGKDLKDLKVCFTVLRRDIYIFIIEYERNYNFCLLNCIVEV
jgi:hypothetical protein